MSKLWAVLSTKGSADQVAKVERLVAHATALLDLVRDTFPTYTLHNHVHAENVVTMMENLLGDHLEELSALESAILLLSAYFHDIGMVYSAEERHNISREAAFEEYLRTHHEEYLRFQNSTEPDESVIEGYCRWRHAERVYDFLSSVPEDWLTWNGVYLRKHLGIVCKSHNDDVDSLKNELFATDFLGSCDLRFCAILLRLADILDFDNSRSPESVYQYLGIRRRATPRTAASDVEWLKHLNSGGFVFPSGRPREYAITLVAGPDHPAVESDVRSFLDIIESELASCQRLLRQCADRWSSFTLPTKIDRGSIVSRGFVFGDFRFKLDRHAILDLFMGENLYSDPSVFVRELLQNSIDATRSRAKLQRLDPVVEGWDITLTDWHDLEGYQWIRIDDNGSGMNRHIVDNYLLRIGKSYYSSPEFQAEMHRHARPGERPLVSIGKFGVGLLSCFMLADQVELSTLRIDAQGNPDKPLRMSFHHVADYSFFQTPDEKASLFPGKYGSEVGYRTTPGTSIAVRIDPHKHGLTLDIDQLCRAHLLATRVPVKVNGQYLTDGKATANRTAWPNERIQLSVLWDSTWAWWPHEHDDALMVSLKAALDELTVGLTPLDFNPDDRCRIIELDGAGFLLTIDSSAVIKVLRSAPLDQLPNLRGLSLKSIPDELIAKFRASLGVVEFTDEYSSSEHKFPHVQFQIYPDATRYLLDNAAIDMRWEPDARRAIDQLSLLRARIGTRDGGAYLVESNIVGRVDWQPVAETGLTASDIRDWSHNGIRLPRSSEGGTAKPWTQVMPSKRESADEYRTTGSVYGSFWLTDELRPTLNIARSKATTTPFRLYSSINFALRRSLSQLGTHSFHIIGGPLKVPMDGWKLAELLADPLMCQPDGWVSLPVLRLGNQEEASVLDIQGIAADAGECVVHWPETSLSYAGSVDRYLLRGLMCINLDFVVDGTGSTIVRSNSTPHLDPRLERYPPGCFLPYSADSGTLMVLSDKRYMPPRPPNLNHKLIEWFLQVSPTLQRRAPALEAEFFATLKKVKDLVKSVDPFADLRKIIDRIGTIVSANGGMPFAGPLDRNCIMIVPASLNDNW